ncbi:YsnF/AvaK domain-containing protein [Pontibacter sp. 13R65]|uniref:YsnF/AvaK domain-containing protein n=1 Tax=Pontibacter sp. 13R65 TaxID=3127458 RepID=UPI00301BB057
MDKSKDTDLKDEFEQKLQRNANQTQNRDNLSHPASAPDVVNDDTTIRNNRTTEEVDTTIPIIEERVEIGKRVVETGDVYISKQVHEDNVTIDVPTTKEHVHIERVPINKYVDTAPAAVRHEGDTMIIPVLREELVVVKKLFVVEELHITKKLETTHDSEQVTLLKEELHVNRVSKDTPRT